MHFLQCIEEGCQRYVSILKNLCLAIDSASQKAVSYAHYVPDFKSYTAALIIHEAPMDLTGKRAFLHSLLLYDVIRPPACFVGKIFSKP